MTLVPNTGSGAAPLPDMPEAWRIASAVLKYAFWVFFFFSASMAPMQYTGRSAQQTAWLFADLVALVLLLRSQSQFINLALGNIVFMGWALIACASAAWSVAPGTSFYYGFQLLMTTLVAFLICVQFRLREIVEIVFWAMLLAAIVAIATVIAQPYIGVSPEGSWQGAFPQKNVMGDAMVLLVISSSCLFLQGQRRLFAVAGALLGLFLIFMTRSGTAILSVLITLAPLPFAYALLRGRAAFFIVAGAALVFGAFLTVIGYALAEKFGVNPLDLALSSVGKERTLTGRTVLWDIARHAIDQRPWLGYGFAGYWADPPAAMLQVRDAFGQRLTFFHNNIIETEVAFGVLGPPMLALGVVVAIIRCVHRTLNARTPIEIWPLLVVTQIVIQIPVQNPLIANHSLLHVLFVVAAVARR